MNGAAPTRDRGSLLRTAQRLSWLSVAFGLASGAASVTIGLRDQSLAVVGVGLNIAADVTGSAFLIWRFRRERHGPEHGHQPEAIAAVVIVGALGLVATFLAVQAVHGLIEGSRPTVEIWAIVAAGVSAVVLPPLARAKHRIGAALPSRALQGDGTLSGIGAAIALLAIGGLLLTVTLGWWWADRVAALLVAAVAAAEAVRVAVDSR